MRKYIAVGLVLAAVFLAGFWTHAQVQAPPNSPPVVPNPRVAPPFGPDTRLNGTVLSGNDIGFRVDRWEGDTPVGRYVVRQDGRWIEPRTSMGPRRLSSH